MVNWDIYEVGRESLPQGVKIVGAGRDLKRLPKPRKCRTRYRRVEEAKESIWGDALADRPSRRDDCFFEALIAGLVKQNVPWFRNGRELRRFLARCFRKEEHQQVLRAAPKKEGVSRGKYCQKLLGKLWGGLPEAIVAAAELGVRRVL